MTVETKYTPGPWEYGEGPGTHDDGVEWYVAVEAADEDFTYEEWIAEVIPFAPGVAEANARLMAAAPDLLSALLGLLDAVNDDTRYAARNAVTKAIGHSN